jgi:4-amino-4-deoxychorismate lyase
MSLNVVAVLGRGVVDPSAPIVTADDFGLTRGDGCFEGLRIHRIAGGVEVDALDAHLVRMTRSASRLAIPFDEHAWRDLVAQAANAWAAQRPDETEAAIKLVLTRGRPDDPTPTGFATISDPAGDTGSRRRDGIDVITLSRGTATDSFADAPWLLGGVKTLSYVINMAAQREAARRDAHEPLFVSIDGHLLEAPTSSVVWADGRTLHTVDDNEGNGILHSITVQSLFERATAAGWTTISGPGTVADLHQAELAMLVSSSLGPLRIRSLDAKPLDTPPAGFETLAACRRMTDFPT